MEKIKVFAASSPGELETALAYWMIANAPIEIVARQYAVTNETPYRDTLVPLYTYCITYK
jgi:hypothetical protein